MFVFRFSTLILVAMIGVQARAGVIVNGDFSDTTDLAGFTATGAIIGEPTGNFAQLETDGLFVRTLEQTFVIPTDATTLSFDFQFSTTAILASPPFAPDSFSASVITTIEREYLDIFVVDVLGPLPDPSDGIESATGAEAISVLLDPSVSIPGFVGFAGGTTDGGRVALTLPSQVLGEEATLYFDLFDNNSTFSSLAAVDNISITATDAVIPEPASFAIWGLLLTTASMRRRRRRKA
jgi:hypothetical protein